MASIPVSETERNFAAFLSQLQDLVLDHKGQYALLHKQRVEGFFDTVVAAVASGQKRFGENAYSVQEVTDEVENLGFYSYAGGTLQA